MGHIRLKRLPATRKWRQVVALLATGAPVEDVAGTSAEAADRSLETARRDPTLAHAVWLLTQIPLTARAPDFGEATWKLGLSAGVEPSLLEVGAAFSDAVDLHRQWRGHVGGPASRIRVHRTGSLWLSAHWCGAASSGCSFELTVNSTVTAAAAVARLRHD